jgi:hypothetical protein
MLSDKFLPLHLLTESVKYSLQLKLVGKVSAKKPMVHLFTVKGFGKIEKVS